MHTISFFSFQTMKVDIHNQCLNFKLTDQECCSYSAGWNMYSVQEAETDRMMSVEFKYSLEAFKGAIMCELRREYIEQTHIWLLVVWRSVGYKKFRICVCLLECYESFVWNENRLREYYQRYARQLDRYTGPIEDTWLIHDGAVLMTRLELSFLKRDSKLNMTISEGIKDAYTNIPVWIGPKT
jgi:hypothetical protein